jgi:SAM-dependent methyltransferase
VGAALPDGRRRGTLWGVTAAHNDAVREQFRRQAPTFTDDGWAVRGLEWIVERLRPGADEQGLDVAAGAGHLARALAPHMRHVTAVDLTPEMLEQGQRLAGAAGLRNVAFAVGDAAALPWLDGQFDLVVCRLAVHQVADPTAVVAEMVRMARPGGRVGITDMVAADDPAVAAETNRLERLRDPSHGRTHTLDEIRSLLRAAGAEVADITARDNPLDLEDWMRRTGTPDADREEIRRRLLAEIDGGEPTGLRPARDREGTVTFVHTWATVVAFV